MPARPQTSATAGTQKCAEPPAQPPRDGSMPAQEPGARPQRPLPYRPDATVTHAGDGLRVRLSNDGDATASAHFAVHSGYDATPRQYDVAPGEWIEDTLALADIAIYGPAGFVRRYTALGDRTDGLAGRMNENAGLKPAFSHSMT